MKTYKIRKSEYANLEKLLIRTEATVGNQAYSSFTYVNSRTYRKFKAAAKQQLRKQYPKLSKLRIDGAVGFYLLNLGPVICEGIKDEHIIVDVYGIREAKKQETK